MKGGFGGEGRRVRLSSRLRVLSFHAQSTLILLFDGGLYLVPFSSRFARMPRACVCVRASFHRFVCFLLPFRYLERACVFQLNAPLFLLSELTALGKSVLAIFAITSFPFFPDFVSWVFLAKVRAVCRGSRGYDKRCQHD
jgi:hypothetical protein